MFSNVPEQISEYENRCCELSPVVGATNRVPHTIGYGRSALRAGMYKSIAAIGAFSVALTCAAAKSGAHVPLPPSNPLKNTEQEKALLPQPPSAVDQQLAGARMRNSSSKLRRGR